MSDFRCEPLARHHDRARFSCGNDELDRWLKQRARQDMDRHIAAVYVLVPADDVSRIAGFYTLSATSVLLTELPHKSVQKLTKYPLVPAILIGRLARDQAFPGIGQLLIADALYRAWANSREIAAAAVIVDAIDFRASEFYRRHGFEPLQGTERRMFLAMGTLAKLFR